MKRIFSKRIKEEYGNSTIILSYTESDESSSLAIIELGSKDENYIIPPTSIVISDAYRLNNFLTTLDDKYDLFNENIYESKKNYNSFTVRPSEPVLIGYIDGGTLYLVEADSYSEKGYKPPKQISMDYELLKGLYKFLHVIYGSPIHLQKRYSNSNAEEPVENKETEIKESEKVTTGWDLIK